MAKESEDLGLKMGSKDMAMWKNTADQLRVMIENSEKEIKINKAFLLTSTIKLKEAERTWDKVK